VVWRTDAEQGFKVLAGRREVERTIGWLNQYRGLSKEYEVLPSSSEAFVYNALRRLMLRRIKAA
jgi:putative transposase